MNEGLCVQVWFVGSVTMPHRVIAAGRPGELMSGDQV